MFIYYCFIRNLQENYKRKKTRYVYVFCNVSRTCQNTVRLLSLRKVKIKFYLCSKVVIHAAVPFYFESFQAKWHLSKSNKIIIKVSFEPKWRILLELIPVSLALSS